MIVIDHSRDTHYWYLPYNSNLMLAGCIKNIYWAHAAEFAYTFELRSDEVFLGFQYYISDENGSANTFNIPLSFIFKTSYIVVI